MRKTWTTLVVLGILLCMFVSLGASAQAAEDALTILAVNGDSLTDEQFAALKSEYTNGYILDVSGQGTNSAFDIVFSESHAVELGALGPISEEHVTETLFLGAPMDLEINGQKITLIGVNSDIDAATLAILASGAEGKVVAVGNANGGESVKGAGIGLFLTTGASDGVQTMVTANVDYTQVVNVGGDSTMPITKITLDAYGELQAEPMAAPSGYVETAPGPMESDPMGDPGYVEPGPVESDEPAVCNVYYIRNGAEEGVVYDTQVTAGNELTLPENGYTHDGYTFAGWGIDGDVYQPGDAVLISADTNVVAMWDEAPIAKYDVTYEPGEGTGDAIVDTWDYDTPIGLPDCPAGWSREGYTFTGWTLDGVHYDVWEPYYVEGNVTFVAEWTQDEVVVPTVDATITYDPNGGTAYAEDLTQFVADIGEGVDWMFPENTFITAPEGQTFAGWQVGEDTSVVYQPYEEMYLTGDVTIKALWNEESDPAAAVPLELTYEPGEGSGDAYTVQADGAVLVLDQFNFTAPEGKHFVSWSINGAPYDAGASVTLDQSAVAAAVYEDDAQPAATEQDAGIENGSDMRTWKIGGTDTLEISFTNAKVDTVSAGVEGVTAETLQKDVQYTVTDNGNGSKVAFQKTFLDGLTANNTYNVTFNFAPASDGTTYKAITVQLHVNPADAQDAGIQNGTDMRTWKIGGTDTLMIQFANAKVATVAVGAEGVTAETLSEGNQYSVTNYGDNGQTVTFQKTFLDGLTASTTYNVNFTFQSANGISYNPISVKLHVNPADPVATPEQTKRWTWNRAYELAIDFAGRTPSGLDIEFGTDNWTSATNDKDYRLNGSTITLLPAMINGQSRWTAWGNGGYTFRVNFTSGESEKISVTVEGTAPTTQPAQPTATPVPGSTTAPVNMGPTSPVTGDETPIALYVAILVLLVAALAIVIILLTKKNRGRR